MGKALGAHGEPVPAHDFDPAAAAMHRKSDEVQRQVDSRGARATADG